MVGHAHAGFAERAGGIWVLNLGTLKRSAGPRFAPFALSAPASGGRCSDLGEDLTVIAAGPLAL